MHLAWVYRANQWQSSCPGPDLFNPKVSFCLLLAPPLFLSLSENVDAKRLTCRICRSTGTKIRLPRNLHPSRYLHTAAHMPLCLSLEVPRPEVPSSQNGGGGADNITLG